MYGFKAKAVIPSSNPKGIATKKPNIILNIYGFMYGQILARSHPYLNEFCAVVVDNFILLILALLIYFIIKIIPLEIVNINSVFLVY